MKDHIIAKVVNDLRVTAIKFHATGQLRERMRAAIEPLLQDITPPVAVGSVDADGMQRYTLDAGDMMEYATGNYVLHADAIAWGAQQREAGYARTISDAGQDRAAGLLCIERERAEKAEAERDTLKESLRLVNVDHGLWMTRTHAAEDARDDALARVKKLEEEMNRTAAGDAYFDLLPNQIVTK